MLPLDRRFSYRFNTIGSMRSAQHMLLHVDRKFGLNLAEYRILSILADRKTPSIKDIAAHTQLDKAHVTRALTDLDRAWACHPDRRQTGSTITRGQADAGGSGR